MASKEPEDVLPIWTVYDKPKDYPNSFVARKWVVSHGNLTRTEDIVMSHDLELVRDTMQDMGLVKIMRNEDDDPKIVECWL